MCVNRDMCVQCQCVSVGVPNCTYSTKTERKNERKMAAGRPWNVYGGNIYHFFFL